MANEPFLSIFEKMQKIPFVDDKLINSLISLKEMNDLADNERLELRTDFLVRGICEAEVDGLLEDETLYSRTRFPEHLRWDCIRVAGSLQMDLIAGAIEYANLPSFKPAQSLAVAKLIKCLDQYDFGKETPVERKTRKLLVEQDNKPRDQL